MKILVTGGCGFIGSNFIRYLLQQTHGDQVVNLDALTYAGNPANLADLDGHPRYQVVPGDICDRALVNQAMTSGVDAVVHLAAESHVDRSILEAAAFVRTNVEGTQVLLDAARDARVHRFVHVSTDEVYGSLGPTGQFTEESPLAPNSPYAASKAGADLLVRSYVQTYNLPAIITRASNNYGPYQFPEKVIPLFLTNALEGHQLPLYGDGQHVRDWLFVEDHCAGLLRVLQGGRVGEVYNIGGGQECTNLELARLIVQAAGASEALIQHVKDRPGHDRRYALSSEKMAAELGWHPRVTLAEGLARTAAWYRAHEAWWRPLKEGQYRSYYERQYGRR
ncbi:MAG TPA: dTDP-glucose 4,6-dehydratase [Candidatus Tectomicrobia bacterium]|nr:dTDP-glucose 4,6-dehydratase [Candidatus Tectomicrobia bacterium]